MLAKRSGPPLGKGTGVTPPGPHNLLRGRLEVEEEHRLGMLLCPRSGVGRCMALCHTPVSRRTRSQAHWAVR